MSSRSVTLQVAGQELSLRTDATDEDLRAVESMVNEQVRSIQASARTAPAVKVHLLAAIVLAGELQKARRELESARAQVAAHARAAIRILDEEAAGASTP